MNELVQVLKAAGPVRCEQLQVWWSEANSWISRMEGKLEGDIEFNQAWALQRVVRVGLYRVEECRVCDAEAERDESNKADTHALLGCHPEGVSVVWHLGDEDDRWCFVGLPKFMGDGYPSSELAELFRRLEVEGLLASYG